MHVQTRYCQIHFLSRPDVPNPQCRRWPRSAPPLSIPNRRNRFPEAVGVSTSTPAGSIPLFHRGPATESEFKIRRRVDGYLTNPITLSLQKFFSPLTRGLGWPGLHCCSGLRAGDEVCRGGSCLRCLGATGIWFWCWFLVGELCFLVFCARGACCDLLRLSG